MRILYLLALAGSFGLLVANGFLGREFFGAHSAGPPSQRPPDPGRLPHLPAQPRLSRRQVMDLTTCSGARC